MTQNKYGFLNLECPYDAANIISKYITFFWVTPLLRVGLRRNLEIEDLFGNPKEDSSNDLGIQLQTSWKKEVESCQAKGVKPNLLSVFMRLHSFWFFLSWLWLILSSCIVSPLQAMILGQLIQDGTSYYTIAASAIPDQEQLDALYLRIIIAGVLVIIATFIQAVTIHPYFFCVQHLGMKMRVASCSLVYQKSLRLSKAALGHTTVGQIVNLISNDVNRFDFGLVFIPYLIVAPLQAIIIVILLSKFYLGLGPTLAGFSLFILYLPFQAYMGKWFGKIREETAIRTDERIRLMNEIIPAMRVIKMYAWEKSFAKLVDIARRREVQWIRYRVILTSINESLYFVSAKLIILICLLTLVSLGYQLTAEAAFVTITMLDSLRLNMTFFFPFAVASIAEIIVSCDRLRNFLLLGEQPRETKIKTIGRNGDDSDKLKQLNPLMQNLLEEDEEDSNAEFKRPYTPDRSLQGEKSSSMSKTTVTSSKFTQSSRVMTSKSLQIASSNEESEKLISLTPELARSESFKSETAATFKSSSALVTSMQSSIIESSAEMSSNLSSFQQQAEKQSNLIDSSLAVGQNNQKQASSDHFELRGVEAHEISAAWIADDLYERNEETTLSLTGINFTVRPGELLVIVGRVGSGKSSILMALLGELPIVSGDLTLYGRISYASQEPWIFAGTIEENILFGAEYDEKKLNEVIQVCALYKDIELMPKGKDTLVGERGISLSGGQKARVNLARALYHDADIYILDDPLSAVDASVAKHIFEKCIKGYLKSKTTILVTHQLQFAKGANKILVVDQGHQIALGSFRELSKQVDLVGFNKGINRSESEGESSSVQMPPVSTSPAKKSSIKMAIDTPSTKHSGNQIIQSSASQTVEVANKHKKIIDPDDEIPAEAPIRQTQRETMSTEALNCRVYLFYLTCVSSGLLIVAVFLSNILAQALFNGSDFYLSYWTDTEERRAIFQVANGVPVIPAAIPPIVVPGVVPATPPAGAVVPGAANATYEIINLTDNFTTNQNSYIYSSIIVALFVGVLLRTTTFFSACMRASINMHDKLFRSVMDAPISFFDFNPIGILLNRISRDMGIVDDRLPQNAFDVFEIFTSTLGIVATVVVVDYINIVPAFGLVITAMIARKVCLRTINKLKEMEGILRSQVFSHLSTTLAGLSTIRSSNVKDKFIDKFNIAQDEHSVAWFTFFSAGQWLGFTLDLVCMIFIIFVIVLITTTVNTTSISGSQLGLAISSALVIVGPFQWGIRQLVELESHMTSVKRIQEYSFLPKEAPHQSDPEMKPPNEWPQAGNITYDNVTLSYFEDEKPVLRSLSFEIRAKEKIGIVGRTGAGKSSIVAALFRMTEPEGRIIIDGIDTKLIGLNDLRRKISIIPQDPILFSGTVRKNLDPFDEYSDAAVWTSLEAVQLRRLIMEQEGGLNAHVAEAGQNFSVGQRQLICLARAILKRNRVLVLDEATANVDPETDLFIQKTIRQLFKDCTVMTIAHRLNTIMDSDRVLVLDAGEVKEFDEPHILLTRGGALASMTANTGQQADRLRRIAERTYNKRHNVSSGASQVN